MNKLWLFLLVSLAVTGCARKPADNLSVFYAHRPKSIVVVPVLNETDELTAPSVFITSISRPLAERGYYVFPVYLTDMILRDLGLVDANHIHELPPGRFYELFGADAVLFVTIKNWSTKYILLASTVEVEMSYKLVDTKTGLLLWENEQSYVHSSSGSSPFTVVASAAAKGLLSDYLPLAQQTNSEAFFPPKGVPVGPYHADYQRDQNQFQ